MIKSKFLCLPEKSAYLSSLMSSHFLLGPILSHIELFPRHHFVLCLCILHILCSLHGIGFPPVLLSSRPSSEKPTLVFQIELTAHSLVSLSLMTAPFTMKGTYVMPPVSLSLTRLWSWEEDHVILQKKKKKSPVPGTVPSQYEVLTKWANVVKEIDV